jgi:WD40 repeat protein
MLRTRRPFVLVLGFLLAAAASAGAADTPRPDAHGDPLPDEALQRLGSTRFRAEGYGAATLSPDGQRIAVTSRTGVVLLDAESGKEANRFAIQAFGGGGSLTFSPDGKMLAVSGYQGVQVLDAKSGKLLGKLETGDRNVGLRLVSFSADGSRIAVGLQNFNAKLQVTVWDADGFKKLHSLEVLHDQLAYVALSADGKLLATWGQHRNRGGPADQDIPRTVQLWDTATGKELKKVVAEGAGFLTAAALSKDGKQLATLEGGAVLGIWDVESGKVVHRLAARRGTAQVRYSPDGKLLAATANDGAVQLWQVPEYKRLGVTAAPNRGLSAPGAGAASSLAFLPDGKVRALGGTAQALQLWEVPSGKLLTPQDTHAGPVTSVRFSPDGKKVISGAGDGLRVWDAATGKSEKRVDLRDPNDQFRGNVSQPVLLAPDGRTLLVNSFGVGGTRVVDLATEQELFGLDTALDPNFPNAAFSADGKMLAVSGMVFVNPNRIVTVRVWDVAAGRERATLKPKPAQPNVQQTVVAVSADGKTVVTAANSYGSGQTTELTLWDVATGKERWSKTHNRWTTQVVISPDGDWIAGAGQSGVHLYEAATGTEMRQFDNAGFVQPLCVAFSPDGRTLTAGGHAQNGIDLTGLVRVWEVATGKARVDFAGHRQAVTALAFSPDGRTLASGSQDTTVLLWDLTGKLNAAAQAVAKPKPEDFDALWKDLDGGGDPQKAYRLIQGLAAHAAESAALVKAKLPAAKGKGDGATAAEIDKLIADLDDEDFDKREEASKALAGIGAKASAALTKALQGEPSVEKKRRVEGLLEALKGKGPSLEMVRPTRALELLERVGTPEAEQVLEELAKGDPDAPLTQQAKATLKRLPPR